jgi:hypothetical protein
MQRVMFSTGDETAARLVSALPTRTRYSEFLFFNNVDAECVV